MTRRLFPWILLAVAAGCTGVGDNKDQGGDTGSSDDTGNPLIDTWRAKGSGHAYLLDGVADHSRFLLEVEGTLSPRDTQDYYGWLLGGDAGHQLLGPFEVIEGNTSFEIELGVNLFENGYSSFEAYASEEEPISPGLGDPLWEGALPEEALAIVSELLISSPDTPNGEGSLRATETTVEIIRSYAQSAITDFVNTATCNGQAEAIYNTITAQAEDKDGNGTIQSIEGLDLGIVGDPSHVTMILEDLTDAFYAFGGLQAEEDVRIALDNAHDCVERVESYAQAAATKASVASCGAQSCCELIFNSVVDNLTIALDGTDLNEDRVVDLETEGTVECAIEFVSRLVGFPVSTASAR